MTSRRLARERVVQILYSWQVTHDNFLEIESYFIIDNNMIGVNISYFHKLYVGVVGNSHMIDDLIKPHLFCHFNKLGYVELAVLRLAVFELVKCFDIPYRVIINEAIELSKIFGAEKSYKFVNGVLDKIAMKIRIV